MGARVVGELEPLAPLGSATALTLIYNKESSSLGQHECYSILEGFNLLLVFTVATHKKRD